MKTQGRGPLTVGTPTPDAARSAAPNKRGRLPMLASVALIIIAVLLARHAVAGFILSRALGLALGGRVTFGHFVIGPSQIVIDSLDVRLSDGDPLFAVRRLDVRYVLRDLLPGGRHRFGITAIAADAPVLTVVHGTDGRYSLAMPRGGTGASAAPTSADPPLDVTVHVRNGSIVLADRVPVAADLIEQRIVGVTLDAHVVEAGDSQAAGRASLRARSGRNGALASWPISFRAMSDARRGLALARAHAAAVPVRGLAGFLSHSRAVRVEAGSLRALDLRLFALNFGRGQASDVHIGGTAELVGGTLRFSAVRPPLTGLHGRLILTDGGVATTRLSGTLAHVPLVARGAAYDWRQPTLRLGIAGNGDLVNLRTLFNFSLNAPLRGRTHVETLVEAPLSDVLIRTALQLRAGWYAGVPLTAVSGRVDYHASTVVLDAVHARYGRAKLQVGARFLLGTPMANSAIAVAARAPGNTLPYTENIAPEAGIALTTLIRGGSGGYRAHGAVGVDGRDVAGSGVFAVDERGIGEFGPLALERSDGSSIGGALRLERSTSRSAAWIVADRYRIAAPPEPVKLAGLSFPAFPPVAGIVDTNLAAGGSPSVFALSGSLHGRDLQVGRAALGTGRTEIGGTLRDVRLSGLAFDGPIGRFHGSAAVAGGGFALDGGYIGTLDRLTPLSGPQLAHGQVSGPVLATLTGGNVVVQSPAARLDGATIRGVAVSGLSGTLRIGSGEAPSVVAAGTIGGRRAVARQFGSLVAVSAPDLSATALRGTGLPLEGGRVSVFGVADLHAARPAFHGTVTVADGRARGYRVGGDVQIALTGTHATIVAATGALGTTYGSIGGAIDGIGERALRYSLTTRVPLGDVGSLRADLGLRAPAMAGSFRADLRMRGSGVRPVLDGTLEAPEGSVNGLAFRNGQAALTLDDAGVALRRGFLTVGSTRAALAAGRNGGTYFVKAKSDRANLADFNDFFDAGDTLAGSGRIDLSLSSDRRGFVTDGSVALQGVRFRTFVLGTAVADWRQRQAGVQGRISVHGPAGNLTAAGSVVPRGTQFASAIRHATYDIQGTLGRIDLGTWLPAAGFPQPVLGTVDARIGVVGTFPAITTRLDARLTNGSIAGYAVRAAAVQATSNGSRVRLAAGSADLGFATLSASGTLGIAARDPAAFDVLVKTDNVGPAIRAFLPAARPLDLAGALDADIRVSGTRSRPAVAGGFELTDARYGGFAVPRTIGALALSGNAVELRDVDVEFTHGQAFVAGSLPLTLQPFALGPRRARLSFDVTARSVDLAQFSALLPAGTALGGTIDGRFGVEGTVDRPQMLGSIAISNGSYRSTFERAPIAHFDAGLAFMGSNIGLQTFHAAVGGGTLDAGGRLTLPFAGQPLGYALDVRAAAAQLDFPAYGHGTLDGTLRLTGGTHAPLVAGSIDLHDAVIPVAAVYGGGPAPGGSNGGGSLADNPQLDIHATAGRNVRLRNAIVDVGVSGTVDVSGRLRAPQLAGAFSATDGTVSSYNHIFHIVDASATFDPADGILPTIDARATSRVTDPDPDPSRNIAGSATIIVTVKGTPDQNNLQVGYSSDPPYSAEQIVGLLLDVPALLGAVNFNLNGGSSADLLRGAPGETNALLPPGVTPEQVSAISFNQEVFSLLNGQFTQRALNPVERVFARVFGLSDLEFTVDYGGGLGYSLRRQIGRRDFYGFLSQTVTYPERSNFGFELVPRPLESLKFSFYQQNGVTSLITNQTPGAALFSSTTRRFTSVQPLGNRSGFSLDFNRRL